MSAIQQTAVPFAQAMDLEREEVDLPAFFVAVRRQTEQLCQPLSDEDHLLQSMPQASPAKWHLAHTTWFFETFLLTSHLPGYRPFEERWGYLFNSYYNSIGQRVARNQRGLLSRPSVREIYRYRAHVDAAMLEWLENRSTNSQLRQLVVLGLNHEQQHQELLLTDIKHGLSCNPLLPAYRERDESITEPPPLHWQEFPGGLVTIGHAGSGFSFDNEGPQHQVYLRPYRLASRLVSCGEYRAFLEAGGYSQPQWWLSDGWDACRQYGWSAPLYWEKRQGQWWHYTLNGLRRLEENEPVTHVSFYEADAFARWAGARLCTEAEWEAAASAKSCDGMFLEGGLLHPSYRAGDGWAGECWQWTASPYVGYPGYRPPEGALGEYNGKFMCNQFVLRGGSCVTPRSHYRPTYRNFFPPETRWQFTGIRLGIDS